jgi:hypothetical protein
MKIIGRAREKQMLGLCLKSKRPEFLAVYGRRRVGKTFLIREYFNNDFAFYMSGVANSDMAGELDYFRRAMRKHGGGAYPPAGNWRDAFEQLADLIEKDRSRKKKVIFIDELPWLATPRSGFVTALEHFWNAWASARPDILLIVCGSASSWILDNLLKNHGGLHNRVTRRMNILPFSLAECEAYFSDNYFAYDRKTIAEAYMVFGGIPFYLNLMDNSLSLPQNVDALCFAAAAPLRNEFDELYSSLFKHADSHIAVVRALSTRKKGLTRDGIIAAAGLASGGGLSKTLDELEQSGFLLRYDDFKGSKNRYLFQLVDFFSLFYLSYMDGRRRTTDAHYWSHNIENAGHRAWVGYAFERVCFAHTEQIKARLGIAGISAEISAWRSTASGAKGRKESLCDDSGGAQIDLLIDRKDGVINICEAKFSGDEYVIDKKYSEELRRKKEVFLRETGTRKGLHLTMVTTFGVKNNVHSSGIQSQIVLDDLFAGALS